MSGRTHIRTIRGVQYRQFAPVTPGNRLFMTCGSMIAIETWAVTWGQHDFVYEVNSRSTNGADQPLSIATTRKALEREFVERRAVNRLFMPFSVGDSDGNKIPEVEMTYGEVAPQVYQSKEASAVVAWCINFKRHRLVAAQGSVSAVRNTVRPNKNAPFVAQASSNLENVPSGFEYLMVYVPVREHPAARIYTNGFGTMDVIGTERSWLTRVFSGNQ